MPNVAKQDAALDAAVTLWLRQYQAINAAMSDGKPLEPASPAVTKNIKLLEKISGIPARTFDGLKLKALIFDALDCNHDGLARSITNDLLNIRQA